jgi:hypothetical protein
MDQIHDLPNHVNSKGILDMTAQLPPSKKATVKEKSSNRKPGVTTILRETYSEEKKKKKKAATKNVPTMYGSVADYLEHKAALEQSM